MGFDDISLHPQGDDPLRRFHVVEFSRQDVGSGMDVQVVGVFQ